MFNLFSFLKKIKKDDSYILSKSASPSYLFMDNKPVSRDSLFYIIDLIIKHHLDKGDKVYLIEDNNRIWSVENDPESHGYTYLNEDTFNDFFLEFIKPNSIPTMNTANPKLMTKANLLDNSKLKVDPNLIFITINSLHKLSKESQNRLADISSQMRATGVICYDFEHRENIIFNSPSILANRFVFELNNIHLQRKGNQLVAIKEAKIS